MKVLQVITSLNTGGAEKLLVESVPIYQRKGIEMDVLSLEKKDTIFKTKLLEKTNGKLFELTSKSLYNPMLIFKIIPYLKSYDVVHVHLFPALYWVVFAKILSKSKIELIYTEHSTNNKRRNNILFKRIDRFIYKSLSKIITIAEQVDENLKKHLKIDEKKFKLIYNGIDIQKYVDAEPLNKNFFFGIDDFILTQVSSFRYPKDHKTLILSLKYLPDNIKLLLIGEGPLKSHTERLVIENKLEHRVKFLGIRNDVPNILKTSDVAILSSIYEGLSLSSIEGMSAKPFIATDAPGLREIVKDYGLLFKQGDSAELANHIIKLYKDKEYYDKIAVRCLERAKEFDIHIMIDKYINVYKSLL